MTSDDAVRAVGSDALAPGSDPALLPDGELARMLDMVEDMVVRYRVADLTVVYCNKPWAATFDAEPADMIGTRLDDLLNEEERAGLAAQLARLGQHAPSLRDPEPRRSLRGQWTEWVDRYLETPHGPEVLAVGRDVTERHLAEERLAGSEVLFRTLAEASPDLVWRLQLAGGHDADGNPVPGLTYLSPSIASLTGWTPEDMLGGLERLHAVLDDTGRAIVARAVAGEEPPERFDLRMRRADGSWVVLEMQVTRLPDGWQGIGRDVTEVRRLQDELASLALRDPLTGMANRRLLTVLLDAALARGERNATHLVLSYIDLDDFKDVNDEYGHAAGDAVLQQVAARLLDTVRGSDIVARLGGDEFIAVHEASPATAPAIHERLTRALSAPYELPDGHRVTCLPSIGTADSAAHPVAGGLIAAADAAMYSAKRTHRAARDGRR